MSSRWKDYEHLLRMAGLFAAGTAVFLIAQAVLVPADFGQVGHYRTGALTANRARTPAFAGQAACVDCHPDVVEARAANQHKDVRCEACHGPLAKHASEGVKVVRPDPATLCVKCHAANPARPASFPQVKAAEHAGGEVCTTCHSAHAPRIG
jgi:predicted CXXCH cytochrome family protein